MVTYYKVLASLGEKQTYGLLRILAHAYAPHI